MLRTGHPQPPLGWQLVLLEAGQDVPAARPVSPWGPVSPDLSSPLIRDAGDALGAVSATGSVDAGITQSLAGKQLTGKEIGNT